MAKKRKGLWIAIGVGLVGVGAVGAIALAGGKAEAAPKGTKASGTKAGVKYTECELFEIKDADAFESAVKDHFLDLAKWLPQMKAVKEDPTDFLVDVMSLVLPECPWPPSPTAKFKVGGSSAMTWPELIAFVKKNSGSVSFAAAPGTSDKDLLITSLMFWLRLA